MSFWEHVAGFGYVPFIDFMLTVRLFGYCAQALHITLLQRMLLTCILNRSKYMNIQKELVVVTFLTALTMSASAVAATCIPAPGVACPPVAVASPTPPAPPAPPPPPPPPAPTVAPVPAPAPTVAPAPAPAPTVAPAPISPTASKKKDQDKQERHGDRGDKKHGDEHHEGEKHEESFAGFVDGNILTVTEISSNSLKIGSKVSGRRVPDGTVITGYGTGRGGVGTYTVSTPPSDNDHHH